MTGRKVQWKFLTPLWKTQSRWEISFISLLYVDLDSKSAWELRRLFTPFVYCSKTNPEMSRRSNPVTPALVSRRCRGTSSSYVPPRASWRNSYNPDPIFRRVVWDEHVHWTVRNAKGSRTDPLCPSVCLLRTAATTIVGCSERSEPNMWSGSSPFL